MLGIVLLGVAAGLAANQVSPRRLPWITPPKQAPIASEFIRLEEARQRWVEGATLFLDAREPADYQAGHIGNALNLPVLSFARKFGEIAPLLTPETRLILYCDGEECELSHRLKSELVPLGYTNIQLLHNGWSAWRKAGFPVVMEASR